MILPRTSPRHPDSSGLKVYGEGEWKRRRHGKSKRRTWRKIHIGLDVETGEITATRLTDNGKHDASQVAPLLEETSNVAIVGVMGPMKVEELRGKRTWARAR